MSISNALKELFNKEKPAGNEMIEHGFLSSSRFIVMIGMVGLLLWLTLKGLGDLHIILPIAGIAALYIVTNTVTRIYQIKANADIIRDRQRLAWADGQLSEAEAATLQGISATADAASSVGK